jgi:hypothetical protein
MAIGLPYRQGELDGLCGLYGIITAKRGCVYSVYLSKAARMPTEMRVDR